MAKTHFSGPLRINDQLAGTNYVILDDANGNELLVTNPVTSAVNHLQIRNAATGGDPSIAVVGDDANADFQLTSLGTGIVIVGNSSNGSAASGSALVNAQRGYFSLAFTAAGTAGTQTIDLVNNKITASSIILCGIQNDGLLTAGIPQIAYVNNEASGSARITVVNNSHTAAAAGTARVNFVIL